MGGLHVGLPLGEPAQLAPYEAGPLMLALGIVLIVIGGVLALIGRRNGEPFLFYGGVIVFAGGALFFLLAVLDVSGASTHAMIGGAVAMAVVPPLSHNDDPAIPVAGSVTDRQPVLVAFIVGAVPLIIAAITALADLFAAVPDWVVPTFTVAGTLTTGLAALWARSRVTPTAMPQLDDRTPLVPIIESEAT